MDAVDLLISLRGIGFSYGEGRAVLKGVNFDLPRGSRIGLIGCNGSGKTTLLHVIMGLLRPTAGEIFLFGRPMRKEKDFREARRRMGFVFQNADDQLFSPTVLEDTAFGLLNQGKTPHEAKKKAMETLERLNLRGFEDRLTHRLSGGEKKLVSLATVLACDPDVLLLDEPTTGLDEDTCERIIEILNSLRISCLIVSHEYDFLARATKEIYVIEDGVVTFNGDSASLHSHYHLHPAGSIIHHHDETRRCH
jgi:cobalt/nickel transport system ATP-binding protein